MSNYSTNLTEKQWQVIKNIVEPQERNRKYFLREILNAIFYVNKSGLVWSAEALWNDSCVDNYLF